jgi:ribosomal protein S6--L-glutamate ligase
VVVLAETKKGAESVINAFKSVNAKYLSKNLLRKPNGKDLFICY